MKIYAGRVDSVHTETFKMLGGLARGAGPAGDQDGELDEDGQDGDLADGGGGDQEGPAVRRRREGAATLEPAEAHTSAALEAAVAVDPLFHKTSAQFDEGGARGLLMNALSVHRGCDVVFDSDEVPDYAGGDGPQPLLGLRLDMRSLGGSLAAARAALSGGATPPRITPALAALRAVLPGGAVENSAPPLPTPADAPPDAWAEGGVFAAALPGQGAAAAAAFEDDMFSGMDGGGGADYDDDNGDGGGGDGGGGEGEGGAPVPAARFRLGQGGSLEWLPAAGGDAVPRRAWAGASHWRFAAPGAAAQGEPAARRKPATRKASFQVDFTLPSTADAALFERPRRLADTVLSGSAAPADTLLPADLRYVPAQLGRYFLKPAFSCARGDAGAAPVDEPEDDVADDEEYGGGGGWDDGDTGAVWAEPDEGEAGDATAAAFAPPRLVQKIAVNYARSAKVVDVRALKAALWEGLQVLSKRAKDGRVSFGELLERLPPGCGAAQLSDISVHMAFICVLHLANEHGLAITGAASLTEMRVLVPN